MNTSGNADEVRLKCRMYLGENKYDSEYPSRYSVTLCVPPKGSDPRWELVLGLEKCEWHAYMRHLAYD